MRTKSAYIIPCECGETVESHEPIAKCPKCGMNLEVRDWGKTDR